MLAEGARITIASIVDRGGEKSEGKMRGEALQYYCTNGWVWIWIWIWGASHVFYCHPLFLTEREQTTTR